MKRLILVHIRLKNHILISSRFSGGIWQLGFIRSGTLLKSQKFVGQHVKKAKLYSLKNFGFINPDLLITKTRLVLLTTTSRWKADLWLTAWIEYCTERVGSQILTAIPFGRSDLNTGGLVKCIEIFYCKNKSSHSLGGGIMVQFIAYILKFSNKINELYREITIPYELLPRDWSGTPYGTATWKT